MKVSFDRGDGHPEIRRFVFSTAVSFNEILGVITERFAVSPAEFKIQYNDEDDDLVEISSDAELKAAVSLSNSTVRVILTTRQKTNFDSQILSAVIVPDLSNEVKENLVDTKDRDFNGVQNSESQSAEPLRSLDSSSQVTADFAFAQKLQSGDESSLAIDDKDKKCSADEQIASDLEFARLIQAQEDAAVDKKVSIIGAAVLGAGVGLLAGGALMAVAGASIGAISASDIGRRRVEEVAVSTGRAATDAGRRVIEATEQHREHARATASKLVNQAAGARARADTLAREALARAREVQTSGLNQTPVNNAVGRVTTAAGNAVARIRARWGLGGDAASSEQSNHNEYPPAADEVQGSDAKAAQNA